MVGVSAAVVDDGLAHGFGNFAAFVGEQFFDRQILQIGQVLQRRIQIRDIGVVMLAVMDFHGLLVDMRFEGVGSIRQRWQRKSHVNESS